LEPLQFIFSETDNFTILDCPDDVGAAAIGAADPIRSQIL
jgi:hypothetical protein